MRLSSALLAIPFLSQLVFASPYHPDLVDYNLNVNQNATSPLEYSTTRANKTYTPSPDNWRALPVYTLILDKFADGDPSNNDYFGTMYESDWRETQLRFGGDLAGLVAKLDYLYGMGVRTIFISGTPFLNMIWEADSELAHVDFCFMVTEWHAGYSPLDFTVLDPHSGTIAEWQNAIDEIHARGMYIMVDFTVGTMSDLIGFEGQVYHWYSVQRSTLTLRFFS